MIKKERLKYLLVAYVFVLLLLSALSLNKAGVSINNTYVVALRLDYLLHFLVYFPLFFLLVSQYCLRWAVFFSLVLAVAFEGLQYVLPYRSFNINDMLANVGACLFALLVYVVLKPYYKT